MIPLLKYPRTQHLEGSRLQPGDEDLDSVPFEVLRGRRIVVEEKVDGANAGLRFDAAGRVWLQSRGHFLAGGVREKHFNLFKQWAAAHSTALWEALWDRFALYGEWLYAKHTIYYDRLPHYFLVFDVLDTQTGRFLTALERQELLAGTPAFSLPPLYAGPAESLDALLAMLGPTPYKSPGWRERLAAEAAGRNLDLEVVRRETDPTDLMEGLYITVEEEGQIAGRYKWVRAGFLQAVADSETHWLRRPIIPNALGEGVDLFGGGA